MDQVPNASDAEYVSFQDRLSKRIKDLLDGGETLFQTEGYKDPAYLNPDLWLIYLGSFASEAERQHHNCHSCRHFIQRFGGLATINQAGLLAPALWDVELAPDDQKDAVAALAQAVKRSRVSAPFASSEAMWGEPVTGEWRHLSVVPPTKWVYKERLLNAGQKMAEWRQDFTQVKRALSEFSPQALDQALRLLEADALYRSEKVKGPAQWLRDLHAARDAAKGRDAKDNVVWRAIATAPAGFAHPRASMVGTLLEDILAGLPLDEVSKRFAAKMHPLQYQRPTAAPSDGAIAQAEVVFEKLGLALSLERRFARIEDIPAHARLWQPAPPKAPVAASGGVFGHLKAKPATQAYELPSQTMTWAKFKSQVLPTAEAIELAVQPKDAFMSLVTAAHPDAPPLLSWDREEARNPVSWYFWHGGATALSFGLNPGWAQLKLIANKPTMWGLDLSNMKHGVFFLIDGAKERRNPGVCIFPETLKSELHGIRSVIEAHSRVAKLSGEEEASAAGLMFGPDDKTWNLTLRVQSPGGKANFKIDRWD